MSDETLKQPEAGQEEAATAPEQQSGADVAGAANEVEADAGSEQTAEQADEPIAEQAAEPSLEEQITQLQDELAGAKDAALRAQAEGQNAKRRAEQEVEKARKFALERFTNDLLPVVDNLERALESTSGEDENLKPIAEGVELTLKSMLDVLGKHQVVVVDPQGEPFDPEFHQAVSAVENDDVEPNTVIAVMQKGYTLNGRLVRAAMVMVSKKGA